METVPKKIVGMRILLRLVVKLFLATLYSFLEIDTKILHGLPNFLQWRI